MNKLAYVYNQLLAIRAQVDAALSLLEEEPEEDQTCRHPPENRENLSTMGHQRWRCGECGYLHDPDVGVRK